MPDAFTIAVSAAREAGRILLNYYHAGYEIRDKGYHNPVTTADHASNDYLEEQLRDSFPEYGWLSEESKDSRDRLERERVWVVDPLDGTKEFIEGVPQFVVSIGLVEEGRPILGVLYNPVTEEIFSAVKDQGTKLNDRQVHCSSLERLEAAVILNSRSETRRGFWKPYGHAIGTLRAVGSVAYKLGLVAAGKADIFATLRPKNEWDICAGHLILEEAGAVLIPLKGDPHRYNNNRVVIKPGLVGGNPAIVEAFYRLYNNL